MKIKTMLNGKKQKISIKDLNDLPLWALERFCERLNVFIYVEHSRIKHLNLQNDLFTQKGRHILANSEV